MKRVTIYTADNEYDNFLTLAKSLKYVERIETDEDVFMNVENWVPSEKQKKTIDLALKLDKNTFISRNEISKKYQL
jgi:hypothetical protein